MQLTKYTDFALRTLIFLGIQPSGERVTITQVSEHFDIPRNHLIKIVHHLAKAGFIDTVRGKGGGIRLGKPSAEINLRELVEATEETLRPVNCAHPCCPIAGHCNLQGILFGAQEAFLNELGKHTLADLCGSDSNMSELLHLTTDRAAQKPAIRAHA
ncbi:Rrf2 family transcriptional regulator [Marinobacterium sp. YM272]|uniref:Rrf2 family transcriptional regulator n=1 Tax=Marinobacterium sp. YM272 TaxID=3421654 RepID=UPI003D7F369D